MTTLLGWYSKQGEMLATNLAADGRITNTNDPTPLMNHFPKVHHISVDLWNPTESGAVKNNRLELGIGFCGSTILAMATIETFRQICDTLSGPRNDTPPLIQLGNLLNEVNWYHRCMSGKPKEYYNEFLLTGYCKSVEKAQIVVLKKIDHDSKLEVSILPEEFRFIVLGENSTKDIVSEKINKTKYDEPLTMQPMQILHQFCNSSQSEKKQTGGTISNGYFNPYFKCFFVYVIHDYYFNENRVRTETRTLNGFDLNVIKELIPNFYCSGLGFSPNYF